MKVVLITGPGACGKSTIVRDFSNDGYSTFHSSAAIRKAMKDGIIETENLESSEAPVQFDQIVEKRLLDYLQSRQKQGENLVVVEAVPRSLESIETVKKVASKYMCYTVMLFASNESRAMRIEERFDRKEDSKRRMENEDPEHFEKLNEELIQLAVDHITYGHDVIYTDDKSVADVGFQISVSIGGLPPKRPIEMAMTSALNGFHERDGYASLRPSIDRMCDRLNMEIDELIKEVYDQKTIKPIDEEAIRSEYADILHFMFCLGEACGIKPDEWFQVFFDKTRINQARLQFPGADKHNLNGNLTGNIYKR